MKILSCYIESFGKLKKQKFVFKDGLNKIIAPNGAGKTTLSVFIKVMLYGMKDTRKASLEENERRHYLSWDTGMASGTLEFSAKGKSYRIERSFYSKASDDLFALYELDTGKLSHDYTSELGRELFGIDADGFERTVFLSERNLNAPTENETVSARLGGITDLEGEEESYNKAVKILTDNARLLQKRGGGGELASLREQLGETELRIEELQTEELLLCEERKKLSELKSKTESVKEELTRLKLLKEGLIYERAESKVREYGNNLRKKLFSFAMAFAGIILVILGAVLYLNINAYFSLLFAVGIILIGISFFSGKGKKMKHSISESEESLGTRSSKMTEEELEERTGKLNEELTAALRDIADCERSIFRLSKALEEKEELVLYREKLSKSLSESEKKHKAILLTLELLASAKESMTSKYLGKAERSFKEYIGSLSTEQTDAYSLNTSFEVSKFDGGRTRSAEEYSKGSRELFSLAVRLAVADSLYAEEFPPLILDDPFVCFDDERVRRSLELLKRLGAKRQIIYFSCSESRGEA